MSTDGTFNYLVVDYNDEEEDDDDDEYSDDDFVPLDEMPDIDDDFVELPEMDELLDMDELPGLETNEGLQNMRANIRILSTTDEEISPLSNRPSPSFSRPGFKKPSLGLSVDTADCGISGSGIIMGGMVSPPNPNDEKKIQGLSNSFLKINIEEETIREISPPQEIGYDNDGYAGALAVDDNAREQRKVSRNALQLGSLDVTTNETDVSDELNLSYKVKNNGVLSLAGFEISQNGLVKTPAKKHAQRRRSSILEMNKESHIADQLNLDAKLTDLRSQDLVVLKRLGAGASGTVRKAFHAPSLSMIAIKTIGIFDRAKRAQIEKELGVFSTIHSPEIVNFYGAFFEEGKLQICLEFMNRGSLQTVVETEGALTESALQKVALMVTKGLNYLHCRHEVHRDIKPGNILLNHSGKIKIADFGIIAELDNTEAQCKTFVGTSAYMSPERISGDTYSYNSDVWSLGLTLAFSALGRLPYHIADGGYFGLATQITKNPSPRLPAEEFSPECIDFVDRCLIKDPGERATTEQLLRHPFLQKQYNELDDEDEPGKCSLTYKGLGASRTIRDKDIEELNHICQIVCETLYADDVYRKSVTDTGRLERISTQLALPLSIVTKRFEHAVKKRKFMPRYLKPHLY